MFSSNNKIRFSIVIPTYNRPKLLSRALSSVEAQHRSDLEILIVNDGSTQAYEFNCHSSKHIVYQVNHVRCGVSSARNRALRMAKGEWILFLDDDDELVPGYVDQLSGAITRYSNCGVFWTGARILQKDKAGESVSIRTFDESYASERDSVKEFLSVELGFGVAIKREAIASVGMFDESLQVGEDTDLFLRLVDAGFIPKPIPGVGVIKHEEHRSRLSSNYQVYSDSRIYNRIFAKQRDGFCRNWKYNYTHLLMWSYRLHRMCGNSCSAASDLEELINLGIPALHVEECYVSGQDLSEEYVL